MRKKIVAGNWKMNLTLKQGEELVEQVNKLFENEIKNNAIGIVCTPFVHLSSINNLLAESKSKINLGCQNCSENTEGAYTGEISTPMLKSVGVKYVIIGHSERREYQKENNELLAKKVSQVLKAGLTPIFCCGETLDIREKNKHNAFVKQQLKDSLFHLNNDDILKIVIAYEPIWAIGTGKTASAQQAQDMHANIRETFANQYNNDTAQNISILYGGSCKPSNAKELFSCKDIDGGLIGGASLKSRDFVDILKSFG